MRNKGIVAVVSTRSNMEKLVSIVAKSERPVGEVLCAGELLTADLTEILGSLFYYYC
jgi:hypothetical protein